MTSSQSAVGRESLHVITTTISAFAFSLSLEVCFVKSTEHEVCCTNFLTFSLLKMVSVLSSINVLSIAAPTLTPFHTVINQLETTVI